MQVHRLTRFGRLWRGSGGGGGGKGGLFNNPMILVVPNGEFLDRSKAKVNNKRTIQMNWFFRKWCLNKHAD